MPGASQREQILSAMSDAIAEQGYSSTTVREIAARAGITRNAFYRHFASKRECFLATYDKIVADYMGAFASGYRTGEDTAKRTEAGLEALFEIAAANPGALRLTTVEIAGAGEEGIARREQLISSFEGFLRQSLSLAPRPGTIANPILRAIVGGMVRVLYTHVQRNRQTDLPRLVDNLVSWATSYAESPAMVNFRDPRPNRPDASNGLWGGRAPGTLSPRSLTGRTEDGGGNEDFSRSFFAHRRREQILDAVTNLTAKSGYAALTIDGIAHEVGVSPARFHEQFASREDAFLVAYEVGHSKGMAIVERAFFAEPDWRIGVRMGVSALFDFLASEPSFAQLALVDALIATRRSAVRSALGASTYAQMLLPGLMLAPENSRPSSVTVEAIAGGIFELCLSYALKGRIADLSELVPRATYFVLAPFIGAEGAAAIATEPAL